MILDIFCMWEEGEAVRAQVTALEVVTKSSP